MGKSISDVGCELGVDYVVEGSVRRGQDSYRITPVLVRAEVQALLWAANGGRTGWPLSPILFHGRHGG